MGEGHEFDPLPGSYGYIEMAFYQRIERYFYAVIWSPKLLRKIKFKLQNILTENTIHSKQSG
ncbi:hypothetical protein CN295_30840 [Bacillus cereus]|nr:hypothetical protein CN295_30840 [Bacillus cereus]